MYGVVSTDPPRQVAVHGGVVGGVLSREQFFSDCASQVTVSKPRLRTSNAFVADVISGRLPMLDL
jgi:hypothetical protein